MDREEILTKCRELGMKNVTKLKKSELLQKLNDFQKQEVKKTLPNYLLELHEKIPKDMFRKVCKQCGNLGHGIASMECSTNIIKKDLLKQKVKQFFLSQDGSDDAFHIEPLSKQLGISITQCKILYGELSWYDLVRRTNNVSSILQELNFKNCEQCNKSKCSIQINSFRKWKDKKICDKCFKDTSEEREEIWKLISNYKPIKCSFCNVIKEHKDERFHFDHINMFDKEESICIMVMEGVPIETIYSEIDKCQILCFSCHQVITHMERAMGFTKQKRTLTRKLNQNEISKEDHNIQLQEYQQIYDEIMVPIYNTIKEKHL
jgi:hypothetical protein